MLLAPRAYSQPAELLLGSYGVADRENQQFFFGVAQNTTYSYELDFGLNTKFTRLLPLAGDSWLGYTGPAIPYQGTSNYQNLTAFPAIGGIIGTTDWRKANRTPDTSYYVRNFDWPYFYSSAYHNNWRTNVPENSAIWTYNLRHHGGQAAGSGWSNRNADNTLRQGVLIYGPVAGQSAIVEYTEGAGYQQETRHRGSRNYFAPDPVTYNTRFYLRLAPGYQGDTSLPICRAPLVIHHNEPGAAHDTDMVRDTVLLASDFSSASVTLLLRYNLQAYNSNIFQAKKEIGNNDYLSTEFIVSSTGIHEFIRHSIVVTDQEIWDYFLYGVFNITLAHNNITE